MESIPVKVCTACHSGKPATFEFYRWDSPKKAKLKARCRECERAYMEKWHERHPHIPKEKAPIEYAADGVTPLKVCPKCKQKKPLSAEFFHRNKTVNTGFQCRCIPCSAEDCKLNRLENLDEHRRRANQRSADNREMVNARALRYYHQNPDKANARGRAWRAKNREYVSAVGKAWKAANPEAVRAHHNNRRARKLASPGKYTARDVRSRHAAQKGRCWWCGKKAGEDYEVDHIFALARGGTNGPENICISCRNCNRRKHAKSPLEFAGRLM